MWLAEIFLGLSSAIAAYGQYLSTSPDVIPLIHKAPYVNSWKRSGLDWPQFFNGRELGWMIAARVDGTGYILQGARRVNYTASRVNATFITPTRTIFTMDAGPVRLNLTYLTPIQLDDWTRHSLPFGHFFIDLWSTDGNNHNVQLYSDMSGEFVSPRLQDRLEWNTTVTSTFIYHEAHVSSGVYTRTESDDLVADGTQSFAFRATPKVAPTWQSCYSEICRNRFAEVGRLENISDTNFRAINDTLPVMAFALDMGNITQSENPLVFAIGLFRGTIIYYDPSGVWSPYEVEYEQTMQRPLWRNRWSNISDAINSSLSDFHQTLSRVIELDTKIVSDTVTSASQFNLPTSATTELTDLVILSVRQTIGSLEITTNLTDQTPVKLDDVRVFMKDIGNSKRVNPLEVIYASFPAFLYFNSSLAGKLLQPLFESNDTHWYGLGYAQFDLGGDWPNAQPNITYDYPIGIESSGSMLILALAHAQKSGDRSLISRYYSLLLRWADFLVKRSLDNVSAFITADGSYSAMSNLALKGITGIYAMGKINQLLEGHVYGADTNRTSHYLETAQNYAQRWQNLSLSPQGYIVSQFGDIKSWGLLYNLYAVKLIGADSLFSQTVYEHQASLYNGMSATGDEASLKFCPIRYESKENFSKIHWSLLAAGSLFQDTTGARDAIISDIHNFTFKRSFAPNPTTCTLPADRFVLLGAASAANGAAFVLHALSLPGTDPTTSLKPGPTTSTTASVTPPQANGTQGKFGYKLGIILAVLVAALILVGMFFYWRRLRRMSIKSPDETHATPYLGEPTGATLLLLPQPSKHQVSEHVANAFPATNGRLDHHAKPSTLRRRAERVNTSNEPNSSNGNQETRVNDIREEGIITPGIQVQNEISRDVPPPPYADDGLE